MSKKVTGMNMPAPKRNDEKAARRWRGSLFWDFNGRLMWHNGEHYEMLEAPKSVTFPICQGCGHVIWTWPHFKEEVPDNAICDPCAKDELDSQQ
jgi:hypothetical protein